MFYTTVVHVANICGYTNFDGLLVMTITSTADGKPSTCMHYLWV